MNARLAVAATLAVLTALVLTATASASEPLEDGDYSVTLPGGTEIEFTISDDGDTVEFAKLPSGFAVVEDDSSDGDTTKVTDGEVTLEVETGDDGKIEVGFRWSGQVPGAFFDVQTTQLPDAIGIAVAPHVRR